MTTREKRRKAAGRSIERMEMVLKWMLIISSAHFVLTQRNQSEKSYCDYPGICGPNENCDVNKAQACECLDGFTPRSLTAFGSLDLTQGCVRKKPLDCSTDVFVTYPVLQEPTGNGTYYSVLDQSLGCKENCKSNCSCMAAYTTGSGGCKFWSADLSDIRVIQGGHQYLYIRMPAFDQVAEPGHQSHRRNEHHMVVGVVVGSAVLILGVILASWYMLAKRTKSKALGDISISEMFSDTNEQERELDLPLLDLSRIVIATANFSLNNKLGEGGFGPVYKGVLDDGQEIAVKRLSNNSKQGLNEFKTEVKLIAKLRHRNLVKLLGCCIQKGEINIHLIFFNIVGQHTYKP
ncbi:hypothetical protein HN51_019782 [Arachis hypogaea]|uniref:non-specific serine/threonine protein kinase n=1 Tax=Arachis hypogaea TaxID=3818 RepID=A0A445BYT7_ARAHY|nr:Putative serine/threonine-protein kinase receptor [Arachis hypogaea]RYR43688.1 hypothetical protein Ahy_A08g040098 isoform B [Arachis hypogaea]